MNSKYFVVDYNAITMINMTCNAICNVIIEMSPRSKTARLFPLYKPLVYINKYLLYEGNPVLDVPKFWRSESVANQIMNKLIIKKV